MTSNHESWGNWPSARLDEIERQLKRAHPYPPKLDLLALQQHLEQAVANSPKEMSIVEPAIHDPARVGGYRRHAALAGAWVCGAIVGGIMVFAAMTMPIGAGNRGGQRIPVNRDSFTDDTIAASGTPATVSFDQAERESGERMAFHPRDVNPLDTDTRYSATIFDLSNDGKHVWPYRNSLSAGTHLIRRTVDHGHAVASAAAWQPHNETAVVSDFVGRREDSGQAHLEPSPPVTRKRLLRELLSPTRGDVL